MMSIYIAHCRRKTSNTLIHEQKKTASIDFNCYTACITCENTLHLQIIKLVTSYLPTVSF